MNVAPVRRSRAVLIETALAPSTPAAFSRRHHDRRRTSRSEGANGSLGAGLSAGDRDKTDGQRGYGLLARRGISLVFVGGRDSTASFGPAS
jgi:hypothetical protein